jgi:hypothetical protein
LLAWLALLGVRSLFARGEDEQSAGRVEERQGRAWGRLR